MAQRLDPTWRFMGCEHAPGSWQMAADLYLYRTIEQHREPIIVRLYRFTPPAITIGHHQDLERVVNLSGCAAAGVDIVRRPTGGRALLHRNEINYAVVADTTRTDTFGSGLGEAFGRISQAVAAGLSRLGLPVEVCDSRHTKTVQRVSPAGGLCASSITRYEVTCRGRKIAGAAQLRSAGKLLQHGMIYIDESTPVPEGLFRPLRKTGERLMTGVGMLNVKDVLGFAPELDDFTHAIVAGFAEVFGELFVQRGFQSNERKAVENLAKVEKLQLPRIERQIFGRCRE